jgi:prolyl oligopeptidase
MRRQRPPARHIRTGSMTSYNLHGQNIEDPFDWLEDPDSLRTREWVEAQNVRTAEFLAGVPQRDAIHRRLTELWNYEKCGVPVLFGGRYFFTRNDGLQNQSVLYVSERLGDKPRALVDPNLLSADGTVAMVSAQPSHDGKLVAFGLATAGSDWEEWQVVDVASGRATDDHVRWVKFSAAAWTNDNKGFYYCRYDEPRKAEEFHGTNYYQKICYHLIGTQQSNDEVTYFRPDHKEWIYETVVSDDGRYLIIHVWNATNVNNAVFYRDLVSGGPVVELIANFDSRYHFVGNDGPVFWLATDHEAPRGRVVAVDTRQPEPADWRSIVAEREYTLDSTTVVGNYVVARYLRDAQAHVEVLDLDGRLVRTIPLPGIGSVTGFRGQRESSETFFDFTSFTSPTRVYRYDVDSGETEIFHQPVLSFDPGNFETRQIFFSSRDGTRIPMFLSYRKGVELDGANPTELYGYGGFNISLVPQFSAARLAWMEIGGICAVANLRGGGEYGEQWHQAGMKSQKQNVFDDFIAAAEWLVANKYTSTPHLGISGRSNGGLLVGACLTQRPDLFGAAMAGVGVLDMLRFHKFTIGWTWVSDYGSPDDAQDFQVLRAYSPYHNVRPGMRYPATLVMTADHDDRVVPAHSYKFAAALQAAQAGDAPVLIRIDVRAGHGIGKPTAKLIDEATDLLSFFIKSLSAEPPIR